MKAVLKDQQDKKGTFPRVTIDPRLKVLNREGSEPCLISGLTYLEKADNHYNAALAFKAGQAIFERMRPAFLFIEAIKVSFELDVRVGESLMICVHLAVIEPFLKRHVPIEVCKEIPSSEPGQVLTPKDDSFVQDIVLAVEHCFRQEVDKLKKRRSFDQAVLDHFDSLFRVANAE